MFGHSFFGGFRGRGSFPVTISGELLLISK